MPVSESAESRGEADSCTAASTVDDLYSNTEENSDLDDDLSESTTALDDDSPELVSTSSKGAAVSAQRTSTKNTTKGGPLPSIHRFPRFKTVAELVEGWDACEKIRAIIFKEYGPVSKVTGSQYTELRHGYYQYTPVGKQIRTLGKEGVLKKFKGVTLKEALDKARAEASKAKKLKGKCGVKGSASAYEVIRFPKIARIKDFPKLWSEYVRIRESIPNPSPNKEQAKEVKNRYNKLKPLAVMLERLGRDKFLKTYKGVCITVAANGARKVVRSKGYKCEKLDQRL